MIKLETQQSDLAGPSWRRKGSQDHPSGRRRKQGTRSCL